jgi:2',3'-cyclic-nucleotide 2'-phosphodiesterase (5'-nucleotidase family)
MKALQAQNPNTIQVGAGDLIGASPLVSRSSTTSRRSRR